MQREEVILTKRERADFIDTYLEKSFPRVPIPLEHSNPYTLLVAVLLSAQCTDKKVNQVTPHLFKIGKRPQDILKLSPLGIEDIIRPCGLAPQKAKAIHRLSEILRDSHSGEVPQTFEELEALPGVGHKTASVVMSQAFGQPAFPVDTHIHRLAQAWGLSSGKNVTTTEKDLKSLFPKHRWNKLHLQIIYFGRETCTARQCDGLQCALCKQLHPRRKTPKKPKLA